MITVISGSGLPVRAFFLRWLIVQAVTAMAVLLFCLPAHAHATLTGTMPPDGAVLAAPPSALSLSFNEPVSLIAATLIVPGGEAVALDGSVAAGTISIALPADLGQGSHALSWRAVSEDGHPISGTTFFVIGAASVNPVADQSPQYPLLAGLLWLTRLVLFLGIFFGVGGAAFRILAELPSGAKDLARWTTLAGLGAVPAILGLQGLDLLGGSFIDLTQVRAWELGLASPYSTTLALAAAALVLGFVTFAMPSRPAATVAASLAIVLIGLAISASGHASVAEPRWLTRAALFVHVTTIAWWAGALLPLVLLLRQSPQVSAPPLLRFSRVIPFAIVPLIASGTVLAVIQLGPPGASWWSPYGQILAAKLTLLIGLFSIASWNRWVLTEPAAKGNIRALSQMRRGIAAEIVIIVLVLGLVSVWRFTPPPRALGADLPAPLSLALTSENFQAIVTLSSGRVGETDVQLALETAADEPLSPKSVTLALEPESGMIAPIVRPAEAAPDGTWRLDELNLPLAGIWRVEVQVRVSDFQLAKLTGTLEIAP